MSKRKKALSEKKKWILALKTYELEVCYSAENYKLL